MRIRYEIVQVYEADIAAETLDIAGKLLRATGIGNLRAMRVLTHVRLLQDAEVRALEEIQDGLLSEKQQP